MTSLLVSALTVLITCSCVTKADPGTTDHLKEIFVGRCWDYMEIKYKNLKPSGNVKCEDLYDVFYKAFSYQAPCGVSMSHYEEYIDMAAQLLPNNKALFWSGTYDIAHEYAENGRRLFTLEDTLIGFLANGLAWCGSSSTGANHTRCPSWTDCPLEASESFWGSASKKFASSSHGDIYLMVDGSRKGKPAYSRNSFFAKYELPNLVDIDRVYILVKHNVNSKDSESCSSGSILELQKDLTSRDLVFSCLDNPPAILHLLCADDPTARECKMVGEPRQLPDRKPTYNSRPDRFSY